MLERLPMQALWARAWVTDSLIGPQPHGQTAEPSVQFCDFCHTTVYRTLLVRVGSGDVVKGQGGIKRASQYRKACPPCGEKLRAQLHRANLIEEIGKMLEEMVRAGATQRELDEYIVGWGLGQVPRGAL